jgi:hypothetical protein
MRAVCTLVAILALSWHAVAAWAADPPKAHAKFVAPAALDEQLQSIASVSWSSLPLGRALASLSEAQKIAIVLDRRVDPHAEIKLALPREPLADILRKVAVQSRLAYSQLGPVAYIGPPQTAARLRTLAELRLEEVRRAPQAARRKLLTLRPAGWDDLAEPRQLVAQWAAEADLKLAGGERIPHDLWAAGELPPMTAIDRITLVLAQFDRTFQIEADGRQARVVAMPPSVALSRVYRAPQGAQALADRLVAGLPAAKVVPDKDSVRVAATLEDHEWIEHQLHGTPTRRTQVTPGKEVYQVSIVDARLDNVIQQLGDRLSLEFRWDRAAIDAAKIKTDQLVSFKVQDADVDELLSALFAGTGLSFRRADRVVTIAPHANKPAR